MDGAAGSPPDPDSRLQHALDLAYRHLGRRDRTALELRRHLERADVERDTIAAALADLERQGYIDDARFARRFAEDRRNLDGWGNERIERRLLAVGVPAELVGAELASQGREAELDGALGVLRGRLASPPADQRERERALGLLVRRGYELELAYDAVRAFERD